jgi:hypothetical protein
VQYLVELPQLTSLDISRTAVTDKGFDELRRLINLHSLEAGPNVTQAGAESFSGHFKRVHNRELAITIWPASGVRIVKPGGGS